MASDDSMRAHRIDHAADDRVGRRLPDNSQSVRRLEALVAFGADLQFIQWCCDRLLEQIEGMHDADFAADGQPIRTHKSMEEDNPLRVNWDSALVTLFRFLHASATEPMDIVAAVLAAHPEYQPHHDVWLSVRNERVSHPLGSEESVRVGILMPDDDHPEWGLTAPLGVRPTGRTPEQVQLLRDFAGLMHEEVDERTPRAANDVIEEAKALGRDRLERRPALDETDAPMSHGRAIGARVPDSA